MTEGQNVAYMESLERATSGVSVHRRGRWHEIIQISPLCEFHVLVDTNKQTNGYFKVRHRMFTPESGLGAIQAVPFHDAESKEDWQIIAYDLSHTLLSNLGHGDVYYAHDLPKAIQQERLDYLEFEGEE